MGRGHLLILKGLKGLLADSLYMLNCIIVIINRISLLYLQSLVKFRNFTPALLNRLLTLVFRGCVSVNQVASSIGSFCFGCSDVDGASICVSSTSREMASLMSSAWPIDRRTSNKRSADRPVQRKLIDRPTKKS